MILLLLSRQKPLQRRFKVIRLKHSLLVNNFIKGLKREI
jgi:hypothetical protein